MWHLWQTGEMRTGFGCEDLREREHFKRPSVNGRIILKWTFMKWNGRMDWIYLAQDRKVAGSCECGNELSGSINCGEFFDCLRNW
jgi:hypothetical protein